MTGYTIWQKIKIKTHGRQDMYGDGWLCFQILFAEHLLYYAGVRLFHNTVRGSCL
jgi:hypothetical protein